MSTGVENWRESSRTVAVNILSDTGKPIEVTMFANSMSHGAPKLDTLNNFALIGK
jgi:hypothetical protein